MANREEWIKGKKRNFESPLSNIMEKIIAPHLEKTDKISAALIMNWDKIFPSDLSSKISFLKFARTTKDINTLYINVSPAYSLEIAHKTEQLLSYIKTYFGYNAVQNIIVKKTFE